jgi:hypothetical protein
MATSVYSSFEGFGVPSEFSYVYLVLQDKPPLTPILHFFSLFSTVACGGVAGAACNYWGLYILPH